MPLVIRNGGLGMDSDRQADPRANRLVIATVVLGVIALACAFVASLHIVASVAGLLGMIVGLWAQMVSSTTAPNGILLSRQTSALRPSNSERRRLRSAWNFAT